MTLDPSDYFSWPSDSHGTPPEPVLSPRFGEALRFAVGLHRAQARKQTSIPYASHLLAVAATVLEHGATEDEAIAALLHDTIEDQSGHHPAERMAQIEQLFGRAVLDIVLACSDTHSSVKKGPWRERKAAYIAHLAEVSDSARLVSLADKAHNARAILSDYLVLGEELWSRFSGGKEGTLWYYAALVEAFREKGRPRLFREFQETVQRLQDLARQ